MVLIVGLVAMATGLQDNLATMLGIAGILLLGLGAGLIGRYLNVLGKLARTDPLTGLLNRAALQEEMTAAIDNDSDVAVMAIDLDNFKLVNDHFGHDGGDKALTCVAEQLRLAAPDNAIIGRLGGDEFCIVLVGETEPARVLPSVIHTAAGEVKSEKYTSGLALSAGYTESHSASPLPAAGLFRRADVAMYEAKIQTGTTVLPFDSSMHMRWQRDDVRKHALEQAIRTGQLHLHFQPELDLGTNAVVGAEGLLRWDAPGRSVVTASEFIGDLRRFGLLPSLLPMIFTAAKDLAATIPSEQAFTIRLNMSADQLLDPAIITHFEDIVGASHVRWCLEVTEAMMIDATPEVHAVLERVRELDVEVALDNFGTGLSSFSRLPLLPFDTIKIDQLFVSSIDAAEEPAEANRATMTSVLLQLATVMKVDVVAEGIETEAQRKALVAGGCTRGLGYLFGPALPATEFVEQWIAEQSRADDTHETESAA